MALVLIDLCEGYSQVFVCRCVGNPLPCVLRIFILSALACQLCHATSTIELLQNRTSSSKVFDNIGIGTVKRHLLHSVTMPVPQFSAAVSSEDAAILKRLDSGCGFTFEWITYSKLYLRCTSFSFSLLYKN